MGIFYLVSLIFLRMRSFITLYWNLPTCNCFGFKRKLGWFYFLTKVRAELDSLHQKPKTKKTLNLKTPNLCIIMKVKCISIKTQDLPLFNTVHPPTSSFAHKHRISIDVAWEISVYFSYINIIFCVIESCWLPINESIEN